MEAILPGSEVKARGQRWHVVLTQPLGPQTLFRLRAIEGADRGAEIDFLHPFEEIRATRKDFDPERPAPLPNWLTYHQAFLLEQALGRNALVSVQPGRLEIQPYQLVPVLRAIRMSRVRLLLADGVGLGKTIQAGLILTELMARRIAHRILIVSPAGPLLDQWHMELLDRFGLRMDIVDRARLDEIRKSTELGSNPFDHIPLGLVSIDFLKQERVLDLIERSSYDVIVIDEAHHCMDLGAAQDREDSQRRRLSEVLARQCDSLLLLTATPHDGNDRSFASICELLDPSLVDGRGVLRGDLYKAHVVRRLKSHIKHPVTGEPLFKEREVYPFPVTAVPGKHGSFIELMKGLLELIAPELRRAFRNRNYSDVLSYISLLKRSVSTVEACMSTLNVVAERFQNLLTEEAESQESRRQRLRNLRDYRRRVERFGASNQEEQEEQEMLEAEDLAHKLVELEREVRRESRQLTNVATVVEALDILVELAEKAADQDPKIESLVDLIRKIREEEPKANILVYTEYVTSQMAVARALEGAGFKGILKLSGDHSEKERRDITGAFRNSDDIILVSTDAAAEGLNLHQRCHHLIHLELPFNPNRLEQRNGRIDRYGQEKNPIVHYMHLRGTFEDRILLRLIAKYERQRARLTFVPNTLGLTTSTDASAERLLKGFIEEDTRLFQEQDTLFDLTSGKEEVGADEATKELLEEIEKSLSGYEKAARTNTWLGDAGLNAGEKIMEEARAAHSTGQNVSTVDLARFVSDAVLIDGGAMEGKVDDSVFEILLPPAWSHGLEDLPGYDSATNRLLLTTDKNLTMDSKKRPVGYLGRAHPLVRRAIDRVRSLSFGGRSDGDLDNRVTVVRADVKEPMLLVTLLGRVLSGLGREMERVLAVCVERSGGEEFLASPSEWVSYANPNRAIRALPEIWETHFSEWGTEAVDRAKREAARGFQDIAAEFTVELRDQLAKERESHLAWLKQRIEEITGEVRAVQPVQRDLFAQHEEGETDDAPPGSWAAIANPVERLSAFANDGTQPPSKRTEADGVLRIFRKRMEEIEAQMNLKEPEIVPLGILMLLPEDQHGA